MKNMSTKLIISTIAFLAVFVLVAGEAKAGTATLTWNANTEPDLNGYKIYYGTSPRTGSDPKICTQCGYASVVNNVSKSLTSYTLNNLTDGATYYFSVSAFDTSNNESSFSSEVIKVISGGDSTPPTRSAGLPTGALAAGTTQATLSVTTNENATCRYSTAAGVAYASMTNNFTTTGATSHSVLITGLTNNTTYNYRVRCQDSASNPNTDDYTITFSVSAVSDTTPPTRSAGSPTGTLSAGTSQTTLSLTTNENATCRYSTSAGVAYASMPYTFSTTGATSHSISISGLANNATYNYRVRCQDTSGNPNTDDYTITFSVAAASSSGGDNGGGGGGSSDVTAPVKINNFKASTTNNSIILTWTNPSSDFAKVILLKSTNIISASLTVADARTNGLVIYESNGTSFNDGSVSTGKTYYYAILAADSVPNYSAWSFVQANISSPVVNPVATSTGDNTNSNNDTSGSSGSGKQYDGLKNLAGVSSVIVEGASQEEAETVYNYNKSVPLNDTGKKLYIGISQVGQNLSLQAKYAMAYFIHFGTPTTMRLGAGERAGAIKSYQSAYGKLPKSIAEWKDVIKIGNGRLPSEKSQTAENKAKETFKKIYLRATVSTYTYDTNAVNIMAYGLRPVNRNINSEAFAIKTFKSIYGIMPTSATQWDIVRAISNSGARR